MKRLIFTILGLATMVCASGQWSWINPTPPPNNFQSLVRTSGDIYVAAGDALIMRSEDGGSTWQFTEHANHRGFVKLFFLNPSLGFVAGENGLLMKTTDEGKTWEIIPVETNDDFYDILFIDANKGYIASEDGSLFYTNDGGGSWSSQQIFASEMPVVTLSFPTQETGYAALSDGTLARTQNQGQTWQLISTSIYDIYQIIALDESTLILASDVGIHKSVDGGVNWQLKFSPPGGYGIESMFFLDNNTGFALGSFDVLFRSVDGGENWSSFELPEEYFFSGYRKGLFFSDTNHGIISTYKKFFKVNLETEQWTQIQESIFDNIITGIVATNDTTYVAMGWNGIVRSVSNGRTWSSIEIPHANDQYLSISFVDELLGFAAGQNNQLPDNKKGFIARTQDGGASWHHVGAFDQIVRGIHFHGTAVGIAVGDDGKIWKSDDQGNTWSELNSGVSTRLFGCYAISTTRMLASGSNGLVLLSENGGQSWSSKWTGVTRPLRSITFVNDTLGFITGTDRVLVKTTNGGNTWQGQLMEEYVHLGHLGHLIFNAEGTGYMVGHGGSFYTTHDYGQSWQYTLLPISGIITSLASGNKHTVLVVGQEGLIFRYYNGPPEHPLEGDNNNGDPTNLGSDIRIQPAAYRLYPNPARESITLEGPISTTPTLLEIRDITGRLLFSRSVATFQGSISFSVESLNPGVYLLFFSVGTTRQAFKFVRN